MLVFKLRNGLVRTGRYGLQIDQSKITKLLCHKIKIKYVMKEHWLYDANLSTKMNSISRCCTLHCLTSQLISGWHFTQPWLTSQCTLL
jgi:hypothetical protein